MDNHKTIIFDFDGTLADTLHLVEQIITSIAPRYRLKIKNLQIEELKNLPANEIIQKIGLKKWLIPFFVAEIKMRMNFALKEIQLFDGISTCLRKLEKEGYQLEILSSNAPRNIIKVLKRYQLENSIHKIYASSKLFSKDKALEKIKKSTSRQIIYIGDEIRDFEACKKVKVDMIAVDWGFNSNKALHKANVKMIISNIDQLQPCIDSYFDKK